MRRVVPILIVFVAVCLGSCRKEKEPDTVYTRLEGVWNITQIAMDGNDNGKLDNDEVKDMLPNDIERMLFNLDGSGAHLVIFNGVSTYYPFSWTLTEINSDPQAENTQLERVMLGDTLVSTIEALAEKRIVLRNHTLPGLSWYIMTRK